MQDEHLIQQLKKIKKERGLTLYELSKVLDVQITTVARWFKTNRINRLYAQLLRDKLSQL